MATMDSSTPKAKHKFLEVSLSPDGKAEMDPANFRELIGDLLDEKLEQHLKPIKEDLANFKCNVQIQKKETDQAILKVKTDCDEVKAKNKKLKEQLLMLEGYQRKNNLRLVGLPENRGENLEIVGLGTFNELLHRSYSFDERTFERVDRLGPFKKGKKRDILARFANFKDKLTAIEMKEKLKEKYGILIFEDLPREIEEKHKELYPVLKALRHVKESSSPDSDTVKTAGLKDGRLVLNGKPYEMDSLKDLNHSLQANYLLSRRMRQLHSSHDLVLFPTTLSATLRYVGKHSPVWKNT